MGCISLQSPFMTENYFKSPGHKIFKVPEGHKLIGFDIALDKEG